MTKGEIKLSFTIDTTKRNGWYGGGETTQRFELLPTCGPRLFLRRQRYSAETSFRFASLRRRIWTRVTLLVLLTISLSLPTTGLQAATSRVFEATAGERLSPILAAELDLLRSQPNYDFPIPVIVQVEPSLFRESRLGRSRDPDSEDRELPLLNAFATRLTGSQIAVLLRSPRVTYVTIDAVVRAFGKKPKKSKKPPKDDPGDPAPSDDPRGDPDGSGDSEFPSESANQRSMGIDLVHNQGITGDGVSVALFDSGIKSHPDLQVASQVLASVDFSPSVDQFSGSKGLPGEDGFGHGTHVAGIIGAQGKASHLARIMQEP